MVAGLSVEACVVAGGPVGVHLLFIHELHLLMALSSNVVGISICNNFVIRTFIPVFHLPPTFVQTLLLFDGGDGNMWQVDAGSISRLHVLIPGLLALLDGLMVKHLRFVKYIFWLPHHWVHIDLSWSPRA